MDLKNYKLKLKKFIAYNLEYYSSHSTFRVLSPENGNEAISSILESGKPAAIGKIGSTEIAATRIYLGYTGETHDKWKRMKRTSDIPQYRGGIFPDTDEIYEKFGQIYYDALLNMDYFALWYNYGESKIIHSLGQKPIISHSLESLNPYAFGEPWSRHFKGRKILVILPFKNTVESQLLKRDKIWKNPDTLPEAKYQIMKIPQNAYVEKPWFNDWVETFHFLKDQIHKYEFDIAVIGAGAWSIPLAVEVKKMGKIGIHMGGSTQVLFGITGGRWQETGSLDHFYNENWTRVLDTDKPDMGQVDRIKTRDQYW